MTDSNEAIAEHLNIAWRFFSAKGYVDGFGHISARTEDPNKILITPHSLRPDSGPEDFVLIDLDGNRFIDFASCGIGATALGYADPDVAQAVTNRVTNGSMCMLNPRDEVELAELLLQLHLHLYLVIELLTAYYLIAINYYLILLACYLLPYSHSSITIH